MSDNSLDYYSNLEQNIANYQQLQPEKFEQPQTEYFNVEPLDQNGVVGMYYVMYHSLYLSIPNERLFPKILNLNR